MAYTKTTWVNDQTELNAENLNHIEDGIANSQNVELIAVIDEAPTTCSTGDKYYNTDDNLIYTAIGTNTWGTDGEEPISGIFYIVFDEQSSYSYDGTTLVSVGGGTEDIVISDTEPTEEGVKLWIDTGEIASPASEITNSYSESTGIGYSANYVNNLNTYSTNEKRIGTWIDGKPLYSKTIYSTSLTGTISMTNIDFIRWKNFNSLVDSKFILPSGRYTSTNDHTDFFINTSTGTYEYSVGTSWTNKVNYICFDIEYTKTTD